MRPKALLLVACLTFLVAAEPAGASSTTKAALLKSELISGYQLGPGWTVLQAPSSGTLHVTTPLGTGCIGAVADDLEGTAAGVTFDSRAAHPTILHESVSYPSNAQHVISSISDTCHSEPVGVLYAHSRPKHILYASSLSMSHAHFLVLTGPHASGYAKSYFQFLTAKDGIVLSITAISENGTVTLPTAEAYVRMALANLP